MARQPFHRLRRHFMTGLGFGAPIALTLWILWSVIVMIDGWVMPAIPDRTLPQDAILRVIPGAGVLVFFVSTVLLGILARGLLGHWIIRLWDRLFDRLPVVRAVYGSLKQITEVVLGQDVAKFDKACLVEYPRPGLWAIGFISTRARGEMHHKLSISDQEILSIFVPTTPNPTSGFLLFAPQQDIIFLDMGVDDAIKLVISAGLVYPDPDDPSGHPIPASSPRLDT